MEAKLWDLIKRFCGDDANIMGFLHRNCPALGVQKDVMERLKKLCNVIEEQVKKTGYTRELDHLYTQILSCIVPSSTSKHGEGTLHAKFKKAGWTFGKHRLTSARKRSREDTFSELTPKKRGRCPISKELQ